MRASLEQRRLGRGNDAELVLEELENGLRVLEVGLTARKVRVRCVEARRSERALCLRDGAKAPVSALDRLYLENIGAYRNNLRASWGFNGSLGLTRP